MRPDLFYGGISWQKAGRYNSSSVLPVVSSACALCRGAAVSVLSLGEREETTRMKRASLHSGHCFRFCER